MFNPTPEIRRQYKDEIEFLHELLREQPQEFRTEDYSPIAVGAFKNLVSRGIIIQVKSPAQPDRTLFGWKPKAPAPTSYLINNVMKECEESRQQEQAAPPAATAPQPAVSTGAPAPAPAGTAPVRKHVRRTAPAAKAPASGDAGSVKETVTVTTLRGDADKSDGDDNPLTPFTDKELWNELLRRGWKIIDNRLKMQEVVIFEKDIEDL